MVAYSHASQPRSLPSSAQSKYRPTSQQSSTPPDQSDDALPMNIMKDPRVVKGTTFNGVNNFNSNSMNNGGNKAASGRVTRKQIKQIEQTRKNNDIYNTMPSSSSSSNSNSNSMLPQSLPRFPQTRQNAGLDLSSNLIEPPHTTHTPTSTTQTQTSNFQPLPPPQPYIPYEHTKSVSEGGVGKGVDVGTQLTNETFNFDEEVVPLLDVLVGKIIEQALLEVNHEIEIRIIKGNSDVIKDENLVELERIEEMEKHAITERQNARIRVENERSIANDNDVLRNKIASLKYMSEILPSTITSVYSDLVKDGTFVINDIKSVFIPWLLDEVEETLKIKTLVESVVDDVIKHTVNELIPSIKKQNPSTLQHALENAVSLNKKTGTVNIQIPRAGGPNNKLNLKESTMVGPIHITSTTTVDELEGLICNWLIDNLKADEFIEGGSDINDERGFLGLVGFKGQDDTSSGGDKVVWDLEF